MLTPNRNPETWARVLAKLNRQRIFQKIGFRNLKDREAGSQRHTKERLSGFAAIP
jgi:hypothetical protein